MFLTQRKDNNNKSQATTPELDDDDDGSIIDDADVDGAVDVDVDVDAVATQKPHFLDYDAVPPDFEESFDRALSFGTKKTQPPQQQQAQPLQQQQFGTKTDIKTAQLATYVGSVNSSGEQLKLDKKYERDGEISDYELAASGYTKKEFTQDDNTLHLASGGNTASLRKNTFAKPKHFLDENPIPPDYMLAEHELREHRSLDRNFERQNEQHQRTESPASLAGSAVGVTGSAARKSSLDRCSSSGSRSSRERYKEPSYTLSRFLDSDTQLIGNGGGASSPCPSSLPQQLRLSKSQNAWTDNFDSRYGSLQLSSTGNTITNELDNLGPKVECVYSLLSMLGSNDPVEMSKKFLELSRTPETCTTLRRSGCIPLLVQMMHSAEGEESVRKCAGMALHNVVHSHPDEKAGRREAKVLRLLDQIMDYCNFLKTLLQSGGEAIADDADRHPSAAISSLMKVSFDEEHRHAMCELGALHAIPSLVHLDHAVHGPKPEYQCCNSLRRYALMALTNLTFGDENNKALLCSQKFFMEALVSQLDSAPDDLLQVTASVLRNLSWRADSNMKAVLNEIGTVTALARAAMKNKSENTLKAILSALWNLSAHCSTNKAEFCAVDGALAFLVDMLTYEGPSKTLKIIENAGGILRNVSSHIAVREHYRAILRERNCLAILLQQLKSESLTVVSNSCGTLWNLSARCPEDQKFLWDNGAVPMLRSLIHSKHAMISEGSSSALKNLLNFRPSIQNQSQLDPIARSMGLKKLPTLNARKQKALEQELCEKEHAETCDNLDIGGTTVLVTKERSNFDSSAISRRYPLAVGVQGVVVATTTNASTRLTRSAMLTKSESRDSVFSAKSDSVYENLMRSHSASDANRKTQKLPFSAVTATTVHALPHSTFAGLENEVEPNEEQPIDYAAKYNEQSAKSVEHANDISSNREKISPTTATVVNSDYATYQETDLDQPTDFSLRYAENQIESDIDISPPEAEVIAATTNASLEITSKHVKQVHSNGSEILLILEDSVKCYQTEDTPYVISNAASVTDLRQTKSENPVIENTKANSNASTVNTAKKYQRSSHQSPAQASQQQQSQPHSSNAYGSGTYTPEKPINYCEEGTPGYFSRYESLSSLDESPPQQANTSSNTNTTTITTNNGNKKSPRAGEDGKVAIDHENEQQLVANGVPQITANHLPKSSSIHIVAEITQINVSNMNSAQETPLMFSRHSSMDSLVEEDVGPCDDKSSVVSDFSRLASGVISPSEIPDSPTQSMPQSPRRNSASGHQGVIGFSPGTPRVLAGSSLRSNGETKRPLRSVFEDDLNTFHVENTPAQFSCATSLSNLSFVDDEHNLPATDDQGMHIKVPQLSEPKTDVAVATLLKTNIAATPPINVTSEGEEEDAGVNNNDDFLLASCITMGMNRTTSCTFTNNRKTTQLENSSTNVSNSVQLPSDEPKQYFTEDTPALLSKVGSNTNLSAISICSSNNGLKNDTVCEITKMVEANSGNRHSLNLSDDVSSNASESGAALGQSFDILQQCIRDGMKKPSSTNLNTSTATNNTTTTIPLESKPNFDPIAMMRRGGNILPPYLPVSDEMNKYFIENSPCSFSVMSGLSNLTVGSSLVGPAVQLKGSTGAVSASVAGHNSAKGTIESQSSAHKQPAQQQLEDVRREQQWQDDSLSSLSIDSEDDTNLLSQAIAAGCNRPKSNLGFSTNTSTNKRSTSLSASQPIPINSATSASSLTSTATSRNYQRQHQTKHKHLKNVNISSGADIGIGNENGNESYSSVDSSDSNDNQSKSLFELCILTGMNKSRDTHNSRHKHQLLSNRNGRSGDVSTSTQSNPNLKQFDSLPVNLPMQAATPHLKPLAHANRHLRERERKDEKLLMECINTGISKKIGSTFNELSPNDNVSTVAAAAAIMKQRETTFTADFVAHATLPKNVQATSAVALEHHHQVEDTTLTNVHSTATPGVEKNKGINISNSNIYTNISNISINNDTMSAHVMNTNPEDGITINAQRKVPQRSNTAAVDVADPQSHEIAREITTNDIGCKEFEHIDQLLSNSISLDNTTSDESNQSFIMETTVSLERSSTLRTATVITADKHKDPDLMLKSVERLTLEFVSSAEQLRTNNTSDSNEHSKLLGSISAATTTGATGAGSNSNNTWNEDTCPNDVSFPSVSVTAPIVASLNYDDDDDDEEEDEQATEADHKELCDFAEITPTNEEQPQPSLGLMYDVETDLMMYANNTQPNSLEQTETETLINDESSCYGNMTETVSSSSGSGINFKLGGEVQTAATRTFYNNHATAMTNSTIIAIEARVLADNLQHNDLDENVDLTFSLNSLDLDNVRPPSGMESLNISGYYQELSMNGAYMPGSPGLAQQPNSLPRNCYLSQSPQFSAKSPKFPRKQLPAGLVARRALGQLPGHLTGSAESVNSSCNLLDNIKPPSLMDELLDSMISVASIQSEIAGDCEASLATTISVSNYETAAAGGFGVNNEFDDNTVTLQSCYDIMPHDDEAATLNSSGSADDGTPLPSDADFSSAESTPKKSQASAQSGHGVKRTLTPKQKRKLAKDRFKTYTIAADMVLSEEQQRRLQAAQQDEVLQIEILTNAEADTAGNAQVGLATARCNAGANRRRTSQERYKTQTIEYPTQLLVNNEETSDDYERCSLNSTDDCASDEVSSIRAMTKQFKFITAATNITEMSNGGDIAMNNCQMTDELNSLEYEQNSETESCHGHNDDDDPQSQETEDGQDEQLDDKVPVRARIALAEQRKLAEGQQQQQSCKTVRGRVKAAYISPYSMQYQRSTAAAAVSRLSTANATTKTVAQTRKPSAAKTTAPPLERQGTFVQDEPTITPAQVPVVTTATSAGGSPKKQYSKLPTKRQVSSMPATIKVKSTTAATKTTAIQKILTTAKNTPRAPTVTAAGATTAARHLLTNASTRPATVTTTTTTVATTTPQRSNSNASIRVSNVAAARIAVLSTRVSATTPPSRSNSNLNCGAVAQSNGSTSTTTTAAAATKINQAQSRIASIWKRVDAAKSKQQQKPQNRPNTNNNNNNNKISTASNLKTQQTKSSSALNNQKHPQQHTQIEPSTVEQRQLIRSTTFDSTPTAAAALTTLEKNQQQRSVPASTAAAGSSGMISKIAVNRNIVSVSPRRK